VTSRVSTDVVPLLTIQRLRKAFGERVVLGDVSFKVQPGAVLSVLGRSGTGKSVLLKCVVGLLERDGGEVFFRGESLENPAARSALRRASSYVFQQNALFDSATVFENVLMPLRARGEGACNLWPGRVREVLRHLELEDATERYPAELSGGMQKRLAVARALVTEPDLVFFDEPTAGLDPLRRNAVFGLIARLQRERGFTAVLVTHDVQEALVVSSHVLWLDAGTVQFDGTAGGFATSEEPALCEFRDNIEALRASLRGVANLDSIQK
jgi:phospholipid/cholesterol/gamma-HCH transport system ATP-binding protein